MQASVSNNTTLKVSGAVSATGSNIGTLYTCGATGYALINISITTAANLTVSIGGRIVLALVGTAGVGVGTPATNAGLSSAGFVVGPSQAVAITAWSTGTVTISGVEFINSP